MLAPTISGKSLVLRELEKCCEYGSTSGKVLADLRFQGVTQKEAEDAIAKFATRNGIDFATQKVLQLGNQAISLNEVVKVLTAPESNRNGFCDAYLKHHTSFLGGSNRVSLIQPQQAGDLQSRAANTLQTLFRDEIKRAEVRQIILEAFDTYYVIDPTNVGNLRIRLSKTPPISEIEEKGLHTSAVQFHSAALPIQDTSDGVKAFVGIISEIIAGDPKVLLIDEPEAFLHPALAFKLGYEVCRSAVQSGKNVFVSTHSAQFLMGCIESGASLTIVRLSYKDGHATARALPNSEILRLMRHPLSRSTGLLNGLFYESVIVTEADTDRAFYQEINNRLNQQSIGIRSCLFINAQNKQTIPTLVEPLRQLGIPAAGILDIDVIKEGGGVWSRLLTAAGLPASEIPSLSNDRALLLQAFVDSGGDMKKDGGIRLLTGEHLAIAHRILYQLADHGLFVVPVGELESWLKGLSISGHGPSWLIAMFDALGNNPDEVSYVKPEEADVWAFLTSVRSWILNTARYGIPS